MCLEFVNSTNKSPTLDEVNGWKVLQVWPAEGKTAIFRTPVEKRPIDTGWMVDNQPAFHTLHSEISHEYYRCGYHICETLEGALAFADYLGTSAYNSFCIMPVIGRKVTTTGTQIGVDVFVSTEMYIDPELLGLLATKYQSVWRLQQQGGGFANRFMRGGVGVIDKTKTIRMAYSHNTPIR